MMQRSASRRVSIDYRTSQQGTYNLATDRSSNTSNHESNGFHLLAHCPQCYCTENRQIVTFLVSLYCLKACNGPDGSIRTAEYHRNYHH